MVSVTVFLLLWEIIILEFEILKVFKIIKICFLFTDLFDNFMQQDAHEFLNYLLNRVSELLQGKLI